MLALELRHTIAPALTPSRGSTGRWWESTGLISESKILRVLDYEDAIAAVSVSFRRCAQGARGEGDGMGVCLDDTL